MLAVRGRILPSTLADITLAARLADGSAVRGESVLAEGGSAIERVFIEPAHVQANSEAAAALLEADLIVIGPGSLYTSVLPNLLVSGLGEALLRSRAHRVYVSNVATQRGRPRATTPRSTTPRSAATWDATTSPTWCSRTATCPPSRSPASGAPSPWPHG